MWAAWEVGAWKVLREHIQPDLIVGASAGAWNGWAIAGGCNPAELYEQWMDPATAKILYRAIHPLGFFGPQVLYERARELYDRFRPRIPFALTMVEVPRLRVHIVRDRDIRWEHLAAACAIPFGFPPVKIDGKRFVDGCFRGALPLWAAEQLGATRAVALNVMTAPIFRILRFSTRAGVPSPALEVQRIEPSERLGSLRDAIAWSAVNIQRWIALGERDAKRALSSVRM